MLRHELFSFCRSQRDAARVPGLIVGFARGEELQVACDGAGLLPSTPLPIGSVTKLLTAATLRDELDRRVEGATVEQLLSHQGGLACDLPREFAPPGRLFGYSNLGFERAAGPGFAAAAEELLDGIGVPARWTQDHPAASGGLVLDCAGLLKMARHLSGIEALTTPRTTAGSFATAVGLGWFRDETPAGALLRHEGRTPGSTAAVICGGGVVFAALSNQGDGAAVWDAAGALSRAMIGAAPEDARPAAGGAFIGRGRFDLGGEVLVLERGGAVLGDERVPLQACGPRSARVPSGPHAGARVDVIVEGSALRWVRWNGRLGLRLS